MHFQRSLPKLPIPQLEDTLQKLTYFISPLLDTATFSETSKAISSFPSGCGGSELQQELVAAVRLLLAHVLLAHVPACVVPPSPCASRISLTSLVQLPFAVGCCQIQLLLLGCLVRLLLRGV